MGELAARLHLTASEVIKLSLIHISIRRDMGASEDSVVEIDPGTGRFYVAMRKTVVDDVLDPADRKSVV